MMRSTRVHSIFTHKYVSSFQHEPYHSRYYRRITPLVPQKPHLTAFPAITDDPTTRIFHAPMSEARRSASVFRFVNSDHFAIESFLRKAFAKKRSMSASEIADSLGMDYGEVREVLARMISEGKLGVK
jgi:hypothetical protein